MTNVYQILDQLNDKVHHQSNVFRAKDDPSPFEYADIDIKKFISEIALEAVCKITIVAIM